MRLNWSSAKDFFPPFPTKISILNHSLVPVLSLTFDRRTEVLTPAFAIIICTNGIGTEWKWMDTRGISFSHPPSLSPSALISSTCGKCQGASRGLSVSNPNPSLCLRNGSLSLAQETGLPCASIGLLIKYKISPLSPFLFSLSPSFSSSLSIFSVSEAAPELPRSLGPAFVWRAVERSGILGANSKGGGVEAGRPGWMDVLSACFCDVPPYLKGPDGEIGRLSTS